MATKVGAGIGPVVTGYPQATETPQVQQQRVKADVGALQVGFFKEGGARVVADGARVQNPILDGDEQFPALDESIGRSMKGLSTKLALQLEDGAGERRGLGGFASSLLEKNFTPDEAGVDKLQTLADQVGAQLPEGSSQAALRAKLESRFGLSLPQDAPFGQLSLMAGLAAAGLSPQAVLGADGQVDADLLGGQLADVVRQGGQAIDEALTMSSGIGRQVSQARTFIHKR